MGQRLFGTDGVRGKANIPPMSPERVLKLGQAIGLYFRNTRTHPRILIGKDTRRSGYMLEQALAAGICSVGVEVFFLGPLPTPGIAYLTRGMRASAGIVISASHNPFEDNGIKIFSGDGFKLPDQVEDILEKMMNDDALHQNPPTGEHIGTARRIDDAIGQYAVFLKEQFPKALTLEGLRIVIDCAHGASYKVAPKVFSELGAEIFVIGNEPNGTNINEQCGALYPQSLRERVLLYKADLGVGLDGDADRVVLVDEKGGIVDGDEILAICAAHMISKNQLKDNTVICTVMSNLGLEKSLAPFGGKVNRVKVGDRYVMEAMRTGNYNLGGEQSGHLIFADSSTTGDGVLAALKILDVMVSRREKLSHLRRSFVRYPQVLKNVKVREKVPLEKLPQVARLISNHEDKLGAQGRILVRYSGTESLARIMVEGEDHAHIERVADEISMELIASIESSLGGVHH